MKKLIMLILLVLMMDISVALCFETIRYSFMVYPEFDEEKHERLGEELREAVNPGRF